MVVAELPVIAFVGGSVLIWLVLLTLLTARALRRSREPWPDDGRPVYRRMPDGRLQFSWGVATELAAVQRRHRAGEMPTAPLHHRAGPDEGVSRPGGLPPGRRTPAR
jgi:hypothetical protein